MKEQAMNIRNRKPIDIAYYLTPEQREMLAQTRLSESITFKTTPIMRRAIEDIAAAAGMRSSDVVRNAIAHAIPIMQKELGHKSK